MQKIPDPRVVPHSTGDKGARDSKAEELPFQKQNTDITPSSLSSSGLSGMGEAWGERRHEPQGLHTS